MLVCDTPFVLEAMMLGAGPRTPDEIGFIDSPDVAVRCHYNVEEDEKKCATVFEGVADAWAAQIDRIGFPPPQADDDGRFDVYLDSDYVGAYTICSSFRDTIGDDGFTGCPAYIVLGKSVSIAGIKDYVAHEFNHALQYAMDSKEWSLPIWEGVATAATMWTYPESVPSSLAVRDYQQAPWLGMLGDGYFLFDDYGLSSYYEYGSVAWVLHLDSAYGSGDGTVGGLALWQHAAQEGSAKGNTTTVLDAYEAVTGDWVAALVDFDIERTRIGTASNPAWATWAGPKTKLMLDPVADYASLPTTHIPEVAPYATGVSYARVTGVPKGGVLHVEARTDDPESSWAVLAVQGDTSGWVTGPLFDWESTGEDDIVVGVVNVEQDAFATTGDAEDLRAGQSTLAIALSATPPTSGGETGDTGDTGGDDTGLAADDTAAPTDTAGDPAEDADPAPGCGCGSTRAARFLPLLAAFALTRGKRRP
jgi:hypothetical protein